MGHGKLRRFAENEGFKCLVQPSAEEVLRSGYHNLSDHALKGHWSEEMFSGSKGDIILELGCGKGDYTVALSRRNPDKNYIGVDIKGARLWRGAKTATEENLENVAFLRTRIEFISAFFAPGEISEIWLTFSDPQLKSENSRLCSPIFLERYRRFLKPGGIVRLKTDSQFLHNYCKAVVKVNNLPLLACTSDLYGSSEPQDGIEPEVREVQTFYEQMFLSQGLPITYMAFKLDCEGSLVYPKDPEDFDSKAWREAEAARLL